MWTMRKLLLLGCAIFSYHMSIAQSNPIDQSRYNMYGVRAGLTYSSISFDDFEADFDEGRIGPAVSFTAEFSLSEKFSIQPEFSFVFVGNHSKPNDGSAFGAIEQRANYLVLPVLAKYYFTEKFYLDIGPYGAVTIWENNDGLDTWDYGLTGGVGYMINENFFIDARYSYGLANVFDDRFTTVEGQNRYFMLGLGYKM